MPKATASNGARLRFASTGVRSPTLVPASRARPYPTAAPLADATNAPAAPTPTATAFKLDLRNGWDGICEASLRAIGKKFACPVAGCADLFTGLATVQKHVLSLAHAEDVAIPLLWVCPRHEQPFVNNGSLYRHTKKDAECKASVERWCTDHGVAYDHYMSVGYRGAAPPTTEEARARKGEGRWEVRAPRSARNVLTRLADALPAHDDAGPGARDLAAAGARARR